MKALKKLSEVGRRSKAHHHVIYINDEAGSAMVTTNAGHSHDAIFHPKVEGQVDEQGNIISPEQEAYWEITPGPDGHTHQIVEYQISEAKSDESDTQIIKDVYALFKTARELERESIRAGQESEKFYCGEQWEPEQKSDLESVNRACLTINKIEKRIDDLSGYQRQQRTDIRYLPVEAGDQRAADLYTLVAKHITEQCYYEREESKAFEDTTIVGRGLINLTVNFDNDIRGDGKIERFPWGDVVFGPHEKEDASDAEYLIKHKMFSRAKMRQIWGEKADELSTRVDQQLFLEPNQHITYSDDQYNHAENKLPTMVGEDVVIDLATKEVRVLECWRKKYVMARVVVIANDNFFFPAYGWRTEDVKALSALPGVRVIEVPKTKIRITTIAGNTVLKDEDPADLPDDDFYIIPIYGKKRAGKFWGKVEPAKDAQREINKRRSQAVDIGNKMAAYGWFYDDTTFPDTQEKEKFKRISTSPGFTIQISSTDRPPQKVEGVKFPGELVQLMMLAEENLQDQMNATVMPSGANESGAALLQKEKLKLQGNEYLFDNLSFAKKKLGRLLIGIIRRYYKPERILRIVSHLNQRNPVLVGGKPLSEFTHEEIVEILENAETAKFDLVVGESTSSPTARLGTYLLLSELAKSGLPVPPEVLIELMDMPAEQREKILSSIAEQKAAQGAAEEQKAQTEVTKTLIAQGIIPPEVQQMLQQQQGQQAPADANGFNQTDRSNPTGYI